MVVGVNTSSLGSMPLSISKGLVYYIKLLKNGELLKIASCLSSPKNGEEYFLKVLFMPIVR